jgi:4-alpha-glucanotransferase
MNFPRSSGILLHPTSLPGPHGIGDLGREAYKFAYFLACGGQRLWQVLPLGPTGYGDSPYQCFSAFAGNTRLISLDRLLDEGLLNNEELAQIPELPEGRVDFHSASLFKSALLRKSYDRFRAGADAGLRDTFLGFCQAAASWLDDYALFQALKDAHGGVAWNEWSARLVRREPEALRIAREELGEQIEAQKFYQFLFFRQWASLKTYCNERGILLVGDIPIFVALDSADVWTHPEQFKLDEDGRPRVVAGVPPDYFSSTGQLWGNPIYNWERMSADGFHWWIERVRATLQTVDILRIDHFRGFAACWEIPGRDKTAENGRWVDAPGRQIFAAIKQALGDLPILAEDLGVITPDVEALRDDLGFPGMRILQFAFGGDPKNHDLPHNYLRNAVVYTGTHDNDTTIGWFKSTAGAGSTRDAKQILREREFCLRYLDTSGDEINWDFIRAALSSVANMAIVPLQDILGLGTEARMNLPGSTSGNWAWRYGPNDLTEAVGERLRSLTELYGRGSEKKTNEESGS